MVGAKSAQRGYYYGWNIVAYCVLAQVVSFGIPFNCISLFLPTWSHDLGAPVSLLALCFTFGGSIFSLMAPMAGAAADRFSVRAMMAIGLCFTAIYFVLASLASHAWQLIALNATFSPIGCTLGALVATPVLVTRWFEKRRGLALGLASFGQMGAGAVLPPLITHAMAVVGWRELFVGVALFTAIACAPLALLVVRNRPRDDEGLGFERSAAPAHASEVAQNLTTRDMFKSRPFWILVAVMVLSGFANFGFMVNVAPLAASRGMDGSQTATLISAANIAALVAMLVVGAAADKLGVRRVMASGLLITVAGLSVLTVARSYPLLLLGVAMSGIAASVLVPVASLAAREFGVGAVGRAMGLLSLFAIFGVIAPPIVAYMRETTGGYGAPLALLIGAALAATLCILAIRPPPAPALDTGQAQTA